MHYRSSGKDSRIDPILNHLIKFNIALLMDSEFDKFIREEWKVEQKVEHDIEGKNKYLTSRYATNPIKQTWKELQNVKLQLDSVGE